MSILLHVSVKKVDSTSGLIRLASEMMLKIREIKFRLGSWIFIQSTCRCSCLDLYRPFHRAEGSTIAATEYYLSFSA